MHSENLKDLVRGAYSAAAREPEGKHAFPVGRGFAGSLGYKDATVAAMPAAAVEAFTGVSNVSEWAAIEPGDMVLDLGCGAGLDALSAAGRAGRVLGVDFSEAMLERARRAAAECGAGNVAFCRADAENLPLREGTIDVALVNGIFNLNPGRTAIFRELARVLRRGGSVFAAELILKEPLPADAAASTSNWFA